MSESIERKVLMQPIKQHPLLVAFVIVGIAYATFWARAGDVPAILAFPVALGVLAIVWLVSASVMGWHLERAYGLEARVRMVEFIGKEPHHIETSGKLSRANRGSATGTGIAITERHVYILDDGEVSRIPFDMIRHWEWRIAGYSKVSSTGLAGGTRASMENIGNRMDAQLKSGFFVTVRDVDKPVWQFTSVNEQSLQRWAEIFRQAFEPSRAVKIAVTSQGYDIKTS